jgi:outer membrane protein assembly factor BamB
MRPTHGVSLAVVVTLAFGCSNGANDGDGGTDANAPDAPGDAAVADAASTSDWPTYQHDPQRSGVAPSETALSTSTVAGLKQHWKVSTGATIEASASVASGTVFVGSWDGNEYAIDAASGNVLWKTDLGTAQVASNCNPPYSSTMGVTASATVRDGVVYTAGGDNRFHALDAATGQDLWSVSTIPAGDTQTDTSGFYTFSSPLIAGNEAYYGVGSGGNCPSVQGAILAIDLTTHAVVSTFFDVPAGFLGGAVWGSLTLNAAGTTLYYGTGNCNGTLADGSASCPATGSYTDALVALDVSQPGALKFQAAFLLPSQPASSDWDFGSTPTMFDDGSGHTLVGAACKDGNFYAVDATTMKLAWQTQVSSYSGGNPVAGDGSISPAAYDGTALYVAAGDGPQASNVYALDPASGKAKWTRPISTGVILGPVVVANGLVYVGTGSQDAGQKPVVQVLDASTGSIVTTVLDLPSSTTMPNFISDSITVAGGQLFFGLGNGDVYAYGL